MRSASRGTCRRDSRRAMPACPDLQTITYLPHCIKHENINSYAQLPQALSTQKSNVGSIVVQKNPTDLSRLKHELLEEPVQLTGSKEMNWKLEGVTSLSFTCGNWENQTLCTGNGVFVLGGRQLKELISSFKVALWGFFLIASDSGNGLE